MASQVPKYILALLAQKGAPKPGWFAASPEGSFAGKPGDSLPATPARDASD